MLAIIKVIIISDLKLINFYCWFRISNVFILVIKHLNNKVIIFFSQ